MSHVESISHEARDVLVGSDLLAPKWFNSCKSTSRNCSFPCCFISFGCAFLPQGKSGNGQTQRASDETSNDSNIARSLWTHERTMTLSDSFIEEATLHFSSSGLEGRATRPISLSPKPSFSSLVSGCIPKSASSV